ncbi:hypothetical protein [Photorhabdus hainanensis]|uniref:hypothetical protein n=1 Tax=Photorhabdus hainanensis TaxID=1004166 RepID=UPI001BD482BF|nr:hypothetical protein [Photorhabdus hainanensis]
MVEHSRQTSKGLLSKSSVKTHDEVHKRQAQSTTLSGDTQDVNLAVGNQLTITTADKARHETHFNTPANGNHAQGGLSG